MLSSTFTSYADIYYTQRYGESGYPSPPAPGLRLRHKTSNLLYHLGSSSELGNGSELSLSELFDAKHDAPSRRRKPCKFELVSDDSEDEDDASNHMPRKPSKLNHVSDNSDDESDSEEEKHTRATNETSNLSHGADEGWMNNILAWPAKLRSRAKPGSYRHLLLLLLEHEDAHAKTQYYMGQWLEFHYPGRLNKHLRGEATWATWMQEKAQLVSELKILRQMTEPLRRVPREIQVENLNLSKEQGSVDQLLVKFVRRFESKMIQYVRSNEERDVAPPLPIGDRHTAHMSRRYDMMDFCKASMTKQEFPNMELDLTAFERYDEQHKRLDRRKAKIATAVPAASSGLTRDGSDAEDALHMMFCITRWLGNARGYVAARLFCKVAERFSPWGPAPIISDLKYTLLRSLCDPVFPTRVKKPAIEKELDEKFGTETGGWQDVHKLASQHSSKRSVREVDVTSEHWEAIHKCRKSNMSLLSASLIKKEESYRSLLDWFGEGSDQSDTAPLMKGIDLNRGDKPTEPGLLPAPSRCRGPTPPPITVHGFTPFQHPQPMEAQEPKQHLSIEEPELAGAKEGKDNGFVEEVNPADGSNDAASE
ncbi:hypothetical protein AJ80_04172 [Polytolypa hystricis UAMH7299]|uniref:Uncharacterized protein n=1 Tax=Polytolypa hystricis (strain UAMH7299) TaxID=1447883 RepID=A0A2B7YDR7_POLH7|nr:hypothetical protein AJ80_04172 [Polytolypa hystricis UAMH7299]